MSHVFLVGATGGVGSRLGPMLAAAGHRVTALHRKPEQAEALSKDGLEPVLGDIIEMTAEDFARAMGAADIVVFSAGAAGSGQERATKIDGDGPVKLIEAMGTTGARRLLVVSVFPDAGRTKDLGDGFEHYMAEKKRADVAIAASDLDWVILRPGTLTDETGSGRIALGPVLAYGDVSRDHVAATLAALIDRPEIRREVLELTDGDRAVTEAVAQLADRDAG